jgi:cytochrome P450
VHHRRASIAAAAPRSGGVPEPDVLRPGRPTQGVPYFPFGGCARRCVGEPLARALLRTVLPLVPRLRPVWPREERMVVRGKVLVPHRSAVVSFPGPRRAA